MDSHDEKLTLENVDEQIEHLLAAPQESLPANNASLARLARNLQDVYEEKRRLEQAWERINNRLLTLPKGAATQSEAEVAAWKEEQQGNAYAISRKFDQRLHPSRPHRWREFGISLAAAILLLTLMVYSVWAYVLHNPREASPQPTATPHSNGWNMQEYSGQYFRIQYPGEWIVTSPAMKNVGASLQTVQFHPSNRSSIEVNVDAMPDTSYPGNQLLHMDTDVKLGRLLSTRTISYHGISWTVGMIEFGGNAQAQTGKLEIAYSNKEHPYRIEFGATSGLFTTYLQVFDSMLASFYPQARTATSPTTIPPATPPPTRAPSPPAIVSGVKVYSDLYFTIQYPATWIVTSVVKDNANLETVQFRPSITSSVYIDVTVMHNSNLSANLLLLTDPDIALGTLLNTNSITYHGISWSTGIVNLAASVTSQASKVEVAYSNQNTRPYRIKFSVPPDMYSSYSMIFNTMLASFYPGSL